MQDHELSAAGRLVWLRTFFFSAKKEKIQIQCHGNTYFFVCPEAKMWPLFQFAKTKKDSKRALRWMVYISEPALLVTTPPEGTWPLLFFFSVFLFWFFFSSCCVPRGAPFVFLHDKLTVGLYREREREIVSLWGETCLPPSTIHKHQPNPSPFTPSSSSSPPPHCRAPRRSTSQMLISHLEEESYLFPLDLLIYI